ncbi:TMAO reductase system periplasmic protein TorT [Shewanella sp. Scap07]|uniref:TMAO reductase system periplasmic protein TorT n=1 Tax=Shewanella sp. Scap07 TaxID=2589987 RepID=UPI002117A436|nr:TMAO reductase system periplasmic protein TorT [Shewanella sp. Scap07]
MAKLLFMGKLFIRSLIVLLALLVTPSSANTWPVEQRHPFDQQLQQARELQYTPLTSAQQHWRICVLMPHLKDTYWTGINYGLVQQAKALELDMQLFEAGGYYQVDKQLSQLDYCLKHQFDAILLGSVVPDLLDRYQPPINKPVIALVNRVNHPQINTRIGVNWYQMGYHAGQYLRQHAADNSQVALFTGPDKQGGSDLVEQGLTAALAESTVKIMSVHHTDNNRNLYRDQINQLLASATPDYILGSAVAIEAAVAIVQQRQLQQKVQLLSSYLSPAVLRGIYRKRIAYSNDDSVVLQGKLAIDVTVRELQGEPAFGDIGPRINQQRIDHISEDVLSQSLAPADYYPLYRVNSGD